MSAAQQNYGQSLNITAQILASQEQEQGPSLGSGERGALCLGLS